MSKRSQGWGLVLVCIVAAQIGASVMLRNHKYALATVSDWVQCAALFCATYFCVLNIRRTTQRLRLFWVLMSLGMLSWFSYQMLWTYIEVLRKSEVPNMFAGDAVLFLHFVPMMAAIALQPNIQANDRELRIGSLDFAVLLLWWVYVYIYSILPWEYVHVNEAAYGHNLNQAYLVEKIVFLTGVALLWHRSSGAWKNIYAHWFGAGAVYSVSSYLANWALDRNVYYSGCIYDVPLVVSMAWMAVPGLLALKAPSEQVPPRKSAPRGVWAARLGMIAVFSLPFFAYVIIFDSSAPADVRRFRMLLTLTAILLMGGLVFLKQHLLDKELIQLLRTSRKSFEDLKTLQAQLIQSEKLASLGNLVGGAAHELNNPLTAMLGYSDLLTATDLNQQQRALAEKISHQANRIRGMVASLLSFAKQSPSVKMQLDVNSVLEKALKICQANLRTANAQYQFAPAEALPTVLGDSNQLLQVFSHVINNAANALEEKPGGRLVISTHTFAQTVTIEFSDNGPGMEDPAKVFDPFYTTRPVGQGTGLGLSMCYGIVQEHGGKITCRNRDGGGATFLIDLPASTDADSHETLQAHAQAAK
jgi:signal transduction histidine kinase